MSNSPKYVKIQHNLSQNPNKLARFYFFHFFLENNKLILKFTWKGKGARITKNMFLNDNKLEDLYHLTSRLTVKLQKSRWCRVGERMVI